MPSPQRQHPFAVIDHLFNSPHSFSFVQAVRLLERWICQAEQIEPRQLFARRLFFKNSTSLVFPASEISEFSVWMNQKEEAAQFSHRESSLSILEQILSVHHPRPITLSQIETSTVDRIEITPAFMSLLGANGALPITYTDLLVRHEIVRRDTSPRELLDIFLHRLVILFFEASRKYKPELSFERTGPVTFIPMVLSFPGLGQIPLSDRLRPDGGVFDESLAYFSGLLQQKPVSVLALQKILASYFRVKVKIEQFVGRWFHLPSQNQTSLGRKNSVLGSNAFSGGRVWQRDLRVRIHLGPMNYVQYCAFLPGGNAAKAIKQLLTLMTGVVMEYELKLTLQSRDVHPSRMPLRGHSRSAESNIQGHARLGWDSFLMTKPSRRDRSDAAYLIHANI